MAEKTTALQSTERPQYSSPPHALIYCLRKSRDNWKRKYSLVKSQLSNLRRRYDRLKTRCCSASAPPF
jgi:hypothetical protein